MESVSRKKVLEDRITKLARLLVNLARETENLCQVWEDKVEEGDTVNVILRDTEFNRIQRKEAEAEAKLTKAKEDYRRLVNKPAWV